MPAGSAFGRGGRFSGYIAAVSYTHLDVYKRQAVDSIQDAQQLQTPITIPIILALLVMITVINDPNSQMAFWFSMIPFTSPVVMMARIPVSYPHLAVYKRQTISWRGWPKRRSLTSATS